MQAEKHEQLEKGDDKICMYEGSLAERRASKYVIMTTCIVLYNTEHLAANS